MHDFGLQCLNCVLSFIWFNPSDGGNSKSRPDQAWSSMHAFGISTLGLVTCAEICGRLNIAMSTVFKRDEPKQSQTNLVRLWSDRRRYRLVDQTKAKHKTMNPIVIYWWVQSNVYNKLELFSLFPVKDNYWCKCKIGWI